MVNANPAQAAEDSAEIQTPTEKVETVDPKTVTHVDKAADEQTSDQIDKAIEKSVDEKVNKTVDDSAKKPVDEQVEKLSDKKTEKQEADEQSSDTKKDIDDKAGDAAKKVSAAPMLETNKETVSDLTTKAPAIRVKVITDFANDPEDYRSYPLAPVEATQGITPDAKSAIPFWRNCVSCLSTDGKLDVNWATTPDTSKLGETTGTIKLSYLGFDEDGNETNIFQTVTIPIYVYAQEKDYLIDDGDFSEDPTTGNKVANTVKFYDLKHKKL